ncbi:MAG: anti-sigma factor, partial [Pseudomonadota bacterium]
RTTRSVAIERRAARLATSGRKDAGRTPDAAGTGPDIPAPPQIKSRLDKALFNHRSIGETLLRWAVGAMLGAAAAASVAFVALNYAIPIINQAVLTAVVEGQAGVTLSARYESFSGELTVARIAGAPEPGRSHELWLIPPGAAPVSLGVLDAQGRAVVDLSAAAPEALLGAVLGVSSAPQGGSATGAPSGAFLAAGALTLLQ